MDYYSDELAEFFYTFDSYDELLELIKLDVETLDSKNIRVKGPEKFKQMQKQALIQWSRIFIKWEDIFIDSRLELSRREKN